VNEIRTQAQGEGEAVSRAGSAPGEQAASPAPSLTGSMLFPDLVWAHWSWQQAVRPHEFRSPRRLRTLLRGSDRRRSLRDASSNGRPGPLSDEEVEQLRQDYLASVAEFQAAEGSIVNAFWCVGEASAAVMTEWERPRRLFGKCSSFRIHRVTDWMTAEAPDIADVLHHADALAIKVNQVLPPVPRRIAMEWIFAEQSYLLGFVDRMAGEPPRKASTRIAKEHGAELKQVERYYDRAASKAARLRYFFGMLLGLVALAVIGLGIAGLVELFADFARDSTATRNFFACFGAGAVGAIVSVMIRMRNEDGFSVDYEVGAGPLIWLGSFRPFLGTIFGTTAYFALQSGFIQLNPPSPEAEFFYFALFAFVAGFSERFTHVILGGAELTIARALPGGEGDDRPAEVAARAAAQDVDGRPPAASPQSRPVATRE
jgi:hypothetical protein